MPGLTRRRSAANAQVAAWRASASLQGTLGTHSAEGTVVTPGAVDRFSTWSAGSAWGELHAAPAACSPLACAAPHEWAPAAR